LPQQKKPDCGSPERKVRDSLKKSIAGVIAVYFSIQSIIFLAFSIIAGFFARYAVLFFPLSGIFHLALLAFLISLRKDFVIEASGEKLEKVNTANKITLVRLSTLPTLLVLIMAARDYSIRIPLLALVVLVFLTDFADGYVSRKAGEVTRVGRILDSASDYSLLIVLTVVFYYFELIPLWFFALVVGRLLIQAVLMAILVVLKRRVDPKTTFMGKAAVFTIMAVYAVEVGRIAFGLAKGLPFQIVEWVAGAIIAASVIDKVVAFAREVKAEAEQPETK
jgi:phosphatidylglycerophosphate synthase